MKKHFLIISLLFILSACHTATTATIAASYEIDQTKSSAAPWKIGNTVMKGNIVVIKDSIDPGSYAAIPAFRVFLGITPSGHYVVQDFYVKNKKKATDPYLLQNQEEVTKQFCDNDNVDKPCDQLIEGEFVSWYPNGQKEVQAFYINGKEHGKFVRFYDNGQKAVEFDADHGKPIGDLLLWSYKGSPI